MTKKIKNKKQIKKTRTKRRKSKKEEEKRRNDTKKITNGSPRKVIHHITICHIEKEIIDDITLLWFNNVIVFDKQIYI
jgi:hypothetical protein